MAGREKEFILLHFLALRRRSAVVYCEFCSSHFLRETEIPLHYIFNTISIIILTKRLGGKIVILQNYH